MRSAVRFLQSEYYFRPRKKIGWYGGTWNLFAFPDEGDFNAAAIIHPHWLLFFYQAGTQVLSPVAANSFGTLRHASPVRIDRFGQLPTIYTNDLIVYDISIRNEFNVEKHVIESYSS